MWHQKLSKKWYFPWLSPFMVDFPMVYIVKWSNPPGKARQRSSQKPAATTPQLTWKFTVFLMAKSTNKKRAMFNGYITGHSQGNHMVFWGSTTR